MDDEAHSSDEMRAFRVAGRLINIYSKRCGQEARRKELDLRNFLVTPGHVASNHVLHDRNLMFSNTFVCGFTRVLE